MSSECNARILLSHIIIVNHGGAFAAGTQAGLGLDISVFGQRRRTLNMRINKHCPDSGFSSRRSSARNAAHKNFIGSPSHFFPLSLSLSHSLAQELAARWRCCAADRRVWCCCCYCCVVFHEQKHKTSGAHTQNAARGWREKGEQEGVGRGKGERRKGRSGKRIS